jgi:hypothetical protein
MSTAFSDAQPTEKFAATKCVGFRQVKWLLASLSISDWHLSRSKDRPSRNYEIKSSGLPPENPSGGQAAAALLTPQQAEALSHDLKGHAYLNDSPNWDLDYGNWDRERSVPGILASIRNMKNTLSSLGRYKRGLSLDSSDWYMGSGSPKSWCLFQSGNLGSETTEVTAR